MTYELKCGCGEQHLLSSRVNQTAEEYYKKFPRAPWYLWPFPGLSSWENSGHVTSWTDAKLMQHCKALVRGDGKILSPVDCHGPPIEVKPECIAKAQVVDGYLRGYDGMYLW